MNTHAKACFFVCECGRHGYVDPGDGPTPDDVFCRRDARMLVGELYHNDEITDEDRDELLFEIRESELPEDIDPLMRRMLEADASLEDILDRSPPPELVRGRTPVGESEDDYVDGIHEFLEMFFPDRGSLTMIN